MKYLVSLFTLLLGAVLLLPATTNAATANITPEGGASVPSGAFYFEGDGALASSSSESLTGKFDEILKSHESYVIDEMIRLGDKNFSDKSVTGGLTDANGKSLWSSDFSSYLTSQSSTTIKIKQGSASYDIFMPFTQKTVTDANGTRLVSYGGNKTIVQNTISAIQKYKAMVQEGVLAGSLPNSFNVYSMYPDSQVPLTDILEEAKDKNNSIYRRVKPSGTMAKIMYSLDYFYNPIFGRMEQEEVAALKGDWTSKVKDVKLTASSGEQVLVTVNDKYLSFIDDNSAERETLTALEASAVTNTDGVKSWNAPISKKKVEPQNYVDSAMRLMVPTVFARLRDASNFILDKTEGFSLIPDTKLRISHNLVYGKENGIYKSLGSYSEFGIDDSSLVLGAITIDKKGNPAKTGKTVGAVIPLWYKEAIYDTTTGSTGQVYWTGRTVKLGNDYSGKITFDGLNKDLLALDISAGGKQPVQIRKYAFMQKADYKVKDDHIALPDNNPQVFQLEPDFINTDGVKGFALFRNNWYIDDSDLISWLQSGDAQAMTGVSAKELLKKIQGNFDATKPGDLTFNQWNRMQQIKSDLTVSKKDVLMHWIRMITLVFGVLLLFYSVLLVIAYWIDILNFLTDMSILSILTRGRLYPISSEEDLTYITQTKTDVKYVTMWKVIFLCLSGMAVGILFIFCSPIIDLLLWTYYKITSWVGVV